MLPLTSVECCIQHVPFAKLFNFNQFSQLAARFTGSSLLKISRSHNGTHFNNALISLYMMYQKFQNEYRPESDTDHQKLFYSVRYRKATPMPCSTAKQSSMFGLQHKMNTLIC